MTDVRLTAHYAFINGLQLGNNSSIYLEGGGGLSLPTGRYDSNIHDRDLPENFNVGKGTIGYLIEATSVISINTYGLVFSNSYILNDNTKSGYHFGNQFNSQLSVYKIIQQKEYQIIPNFGIGAEHTSTDNYTNNRAVEGTGGNGIFASTSLNFKTNTWQIGTSFSLPLAEIFSDGEVKSKGRISGHISYIF
ncbi:MAG: hypothetical protein V3V14_12415 [Saprospiraceae bacterium]